MRRSFEPFTYKLTTLVSETDACEVRAWNPRHEIKIEKCRHSVSSVFGTTTEVRSQYGSTCVEGSGESVLGNGTNSPQRNSLPSGDFIPLRPWLMVGFSFLGNPFILTGLPSDPIGNFVIVGLAAMRC